MKVLSGAVQFEHYPRTFTFAHLATQPRNQCFDIGKYDPTLGRLPEDCLEGAAMLGLHAAMISYFDINYQNPGPAGDLMIANPGRADLSPAGTHD